MAAQCVDVDDLHLASQEPLRSCQRSNCPECNKRMTFFCFDCIVALTQGVPHIDLPVQIDILQHGETNGRSTGTQAALLAPNHVKVIRHTDGSSHHRRQDPLSLPVPSYDPDTTAVLFPENQETPCVGDPCCPAFSRAVVIEGSWQKAKQLVSRHPQLQGLPRVQLPGDVRSIYWRRGAGHVKGAAEQGVCTIECIYHLARALDPHGSYDNLLWYFTHIRSLVSAQAGTMTKRFLAVQEAARSQHKKLKASEDTNPSHQQGADGAGDSNMKQSIATTQAPGAGEVVDASVAGTSVGAAANLSTQDPDARQSRQAHTRIG